MPTLFHFLQGSAAGAPCDAAYSGCSGLAWLCKRNDMIGRARLEIRASATSVS
jgi:hypothetical protein